MANMARFALQLGDRRFDVPERGLRIGRAPDNDIVLPDAQVSGHHAQVWRQEGQSYVRDLGSTNGTFLSGRRIAGIEALRPGDVVQVGNTRLAVTMAVGSQSAAPRNVRTIAFAGMAAVAILFVILAVLVRQPARSIRPATPTLIAAQSGPSPTPTPALAPLERARLATVLISGFWGQGSGSVVDPRGYILTNAHVVSDETTLEIAINTSSQSDPPQIAYLAEVAAIDEGLDLALLQIVADADGNAVISDLQLITLPIGDSDRVRLGDEIDILGFPGVGGETLTLSKGTVSGFIGDGAFSRGWIKTDAEISPGNSGGTAIDDSGDLIGIPTLVSTEEETSGRIGVLRPVNLARPLLSNIP